jgi:hypothetical protein
MRHEPWLESSTYMRPRLIWPLLDEAHAGKEIILAKAGKPYARLMPLVQRLGAGFFEPLPADELDAWESR